MSGYEHFPVALSQNPCTPLRRQPVLSAQRLRHSLNTEPSQIEYSPAQSPSLSQVHCMSFGLGTPGAARHSLPVVLLAQSAGPVQTQKLKPVPARSVVSQTGPAARGLLAQSAVLKHSSQRFPAAGFFTQCVSLKAVHSASQLPGGVTLHAVLLSH
jgi:hypothetical protein